MFLTCKRVSESTKSNLNTVTNIQKYILTPWIFEYGSYCLSSFLISFSNLFVIMKKISSSAIRRYNTTLIHITCSPAYHIIPLFFTPDTLCTLTLLHPTHIHATPTFLHPWDPWTLLLVSPTPPSPSLLLFLLLQVAIWCLITDRPFRMSYIWWHAIPVPVVSWIWMSHDWIVAEPWPKAISWIWADSQGKHNGHKANKKSTTKNLCRYTLNLFHLYKLRLECKNWSCKMHLTEWTFLAGEL